MSDDTIMIRMSPEELKRAMREAIREEFELLGIVAEDAEDREKIRDDFRFMRRLRLAMNRASSRIGNAVLLTLTGAVLSLILYGFQAKFGR